jgi:hypothetical protein
MRVTVYFKNPVQPPLILELKEGERVKLSATQGTSGLRSLGNAPDGSPIYVQSEEIIAIVPESADRTAVDGGA